MIPTIFRKESLTERQERKKERPTPKIAAAIAGISALVTVVLLIVVAGVTNTVGVQLIDDLDDDFTAGSAEAHAAQNTTEALGNISKRMPLLSTALMFGLIITVVVAAFSFARR